MSCTCNFGKALGTCHCASCHVTFTCSSAFAIHQRIAEEPDGWGLVECADPEGISRLTPLRETPDGAPIWGWKDTRPKGLHDVLARK